MTERPDTQAIIDTATRAARPMALEAGTTNAFIVPAGGSVHLVELDTDEHRRRAGQPPATSLAETTTVRDAAGLIALADRWGRFDSTVVYADVTTRQVIAVLDDDVHHDVPGWRDRRVNLQLIPTPAWTAWTKTDGDLMDQAVYAEFIEDHLDDIRDPTAADMLELAQSLEANIGVQFKSAVRLANGQRQFQYEENQSATAGHAGAIEIPERFTIALAVWATGDAEPVAVDVRFRYRITQGGLKLGHALLNVEELMRIRFETEIIRPIEEHGLPVIRGLA